MTPSPTDRCLARLTELGIDTLTHEHEAVFTVAQSAGVTGALPGAHSKNLFLKDRKGRLFLVSARDTTAIDLRRLHEAIGASGRLSFGSADLLREVLGVEPGSVTPFAVMNDAAGRVAMVLDAELMKEEVLNFHPLVNTRTTAIGRDDMLTFLRATGHDPLVTALPASVPEICVAADANPS